MADDYYSRPESPGTSRPVYGTRSGKLVKGKLLPKIRSVQVNFEDDGSSQPGLYLSGSTLKGILKLDILKPTSVVRLRVIVEGIVRVADMKKTVISNNQILFGTEKGRKSPVKMAIGQYYYPFTVELPQDLPTTIFRNELLKASYKCSAIVIRKQIADDIIVERPFIVHNVTQSIYEQVGIGQSSMDKTLQFNGVSALVTLPRTGFYLGENLDVAVVVENPTTASRRIKVGIRVVRTIVGHGALYFGPIKMNQTKNHVTVVTDRWSEFFKVPKRGSEELDVSVPLNLMEPTTQHELIDIEYLAHVSFITQGVLSDSKSKSVSFSITIAPPRSLSQYPESYTLQAPDQAYQDFEIASTSNDVSLAQTTENIYPSLDDALSSMTPNVFPTAPDMEDSDEDNENVKLPSYDDVIAGKV